MSLINDVKLIQDRQTIANLINNVAELKAQKAETIALLQALKPTIKADVLNDVYNKNDFITAGKNLQFLQTINEKLNQLKTELPAFLPLLQNVAYEAELQTVIDSI